MDTALQAVTIRTLTHDAEAAIPYLADILLDCVESGASVSFMAPLSLEKAEGFWLGVVAGVAEGRRILLVAEDDGGELVGTVQLLLDLPESQPHRTEVAKMLVRRSARRQGIARRLMQAVEEAALAAGRTLILLDTVTDSPAERLYESLGWQRVGIVPNFALFPDGRPCSTTFFYRNLASS
jgi:GNAT superfamily N-acetyltransferase